MAAPPPLVGPRYDDFIQVPREREIDQDGENPGVLFTR